MMRKVMCRDRNRTIQNRRRRLFENLETRHLMAALELSPVGTFATNVFDEGGAEIVSYDSQSQRAFFTSASANELGVLDLSNPAAPTPVAGLSPIDLSSYGGGPNSVAVSNGIVAVAVQADIKTDPGSVVLFDTNGNYLDQFLVGALPDMLTFSPDGTKLLVANEGEPNSYGESDSVDPEGSISIIDLSSGTVATADFTAFNGLKDDLIAQGVRLYGPGATVAQDFEPEYITVSDDGTTAYVTLQENNALAVVDIASATVTEVLPLGYKDHSLAGNELDASDRDGVVNIQSWPVLGMYQPDAIASYTIDGKTYLITANEGDARDYDGLEEETRVRDLELDSTSFPNASSLQANENIGRLTVTTVNGDTDGDGDYDQLYALGARSFSIWTAEGDQVYDSGDEIEQITAAAFPGFFNSSNDGNALDNRSDNKGPEPEGVTLGVIDGRTYAFIGLERIGGVMIYDVTNPMNPVFQQYVNNRDFSEDPESGQPLDLGPEGLTFVSADDSPNGIPLLLVANEISGTVTVYQVGTQAETTPYLVPVANGVEFQTILTTGDNVGGYTMAGTPDGLGAFDNGDGTFTVLINHEFSTTVGIAHTHNASLGTDGAGSYIDRLVIRKSDLAVISGGDQIQQVLDGETFEPLEGDDLNLSRLCSGDLPDVGAFYNASSGLGTQSRIFLTGEETSGGRAIASVVSGPENGLTYTLPLFGGAAWENLLANPDSGDTTLVMGNADTGGGKIYAYVGTKLGAGNEIQKAGLTNGITYEIRINADGSFDLVGPGEGTPFDRPEDGAWDPNNPSDFYFVTTAGFNTAATPRNSQLFRMRFNDVTDPTSGGTVEVLIDGQGVAQMFDNIAVDKLGRVLIQEDPGGNPYLAKIWAYDIASGALIELAQHDPARFVMGGAEFLTENEESSGVIDVSDILGEGTYLLDVQPHYSTTPTLVEGGQLLIMRTGAIVGLGFDAANNNEPALVILGTSKNDKIEVEQERGRIEVVISKQEYSFDAAAVDQIIAVGYGGNDKIDLDNVYVPTSIFGGDGNDKLKGGKKQDLFTGGSGNDQFTVGLPENDLILDLGDGNDKVKTKTHK